MWNNRFFLVSLILIVISINIDKCLSVCYVETPCGEAGWDSRRIVGGQEVGGYTYPWIALLLEPINGPICSGTLITPKFVITAAHCIPESYWKRTLIVFGAYDICEREESGHTMHTIKHVTYHLWFRNETVDGVWLRFYDVAIIEMTVASELVPICLPCADLPINSVIMSLGWGSATAISPTPNCKQKQTFFERIAGPGCDIDNESYEICAVDSTSSTCIVDEGGPGMVGNEYNNFVIAGVLGTVPRNCSPNDGYQVFMNLHQVMDWIVSTITREDI